MSSGVLVAPAWAKPGPRESGKYDITVSGYYAGTGTAVASLSRVSIEAPLKDEAGNRFVLKATELKRDPERHYVFRGTGTLNEKAVQIDGRIDAADDHNGEVLKAGRILFTFKVMDAVGRHGRGSGEKVSKAATPIQGSGGGGGGGGGPGGSGGSGPDTSHKHKSR